MLVGREPVPVHLVYARSQRLQRDVQLLSIVRIDRDLAVVHLIARGIRHGDAAEGGFDFLSEP